MLYFYKKSTDNLDIHINIAVFKKKFLYILKICDIISRNKDKEGGYMQKKTSVLFSGGLDSSLVACYMAERGYEIYLNHFDNGALISNNLYEVRYKEISDIYSKSNIYLNHMNCAGLFRKISLANIEGDIINFSKNLVCMGCKLSMHVENILFCLNNNIHLVVDGSTKKQEKYAEQREISIQHIKELYNQYDIDYLNPIYNLTKKQIKYELFDRGITIQSLEDTCLFSNTFSEATDETIKKYIENKLSFCYKFIERRFSMDTIDKVGGIILKDKKILVVKKKTDDNRCEYIIPGGKREGNETDFQTLSRELKEELQVRLDSFVSLGGYDDIAIFENIPIHIEVYFANISGEPKCDSEIKEAVWIDRNYKENNIKLGSVLEKFVIPKLIEKQLM